MVDAGKFESLTTSAVKIAKDMAKKKSVLVDGVADFKFDSFM